MPKVESHHTRIPSRRDVIRTGGKVAAAAAIGVAVATVPAPAGDDAEIIALGREVSRLAAMTGGDADIGRATSMMTRIETRISGLKATTFAALAVKLRIAADQLLLEDDDWRSSDQLNLLSALADVERVAALSGVEVRA